MNIKFVSSLLVAIALSACTTTKLDNADVADASATAVTQPTQPANPVTPPPAQYTVQSVVLHPLDDPNSALAKRSIYFDYDKYEIASTGRALVEEHGKYLRSHSTAQVRLEGHADERGSREYNLALGQKRAEAVRQAMTLMGVSDKQVEAVSFGKEKPADPGHDEAAWAKNRRVDISYQAR